MTISTTYVAYMYKTFFGNKIIERKERRLKFTIMIIRLRMVHRGKIHLHKSKYYFVSDTCDEGEQCTTVTRFEIVKLARFISS